MLSANLFSPISAPTDGDVVLERDFLAILESAYACSLRDVRVCTGPRANAITNSLGAAAAAWRTEVFLSDCVLRSGPAAVRTVLAHELAHVAQKRLSGRPSMRDASSPAYRTQLERDASASAAAALAGRRRPPRIPDMPDVFSLWGPEGHYYTTFYVAMAAGLGEVRAKEIAFYCQLPDQVEELDAIAVAMKMAAVMGLPTTKTEGALLALSHPEITATGVAFYFGEKMVSAFQDPSMMTWTNTWKARAQPAAKQFQQAAMRAMYKSPETFENLLTVQRGLHCLTGANSRTETAFRRDIAERIPRSGAFGGDWALGLALHAFGDSYAHRYIDDPEWMYDWGAGHAVEAQQGHEPDNINHPGRRLFYAVYGEGMYNIFLKRSEAPSPKVKAEDLKKTLNDVSSRSGKRDQSEALIAAAIGLGGRPSDEWKYEPDAVPLEKFRRPGVDSNRLKEILTMAETWRVKGHKAIGDFPTPVAPATQKA